MSVSLYTQGRHGTEPLDRSRCRAWSVNRGAQCVNRPTGKFEGVPLCGVHRNLAKKTGLMIKPGKLWAEREAEREIGKDITHLVHTIDGRKR
jgi:hypothetical protein